MIKKSESRPKSRKDSIIAKLNESKNQIMKLSQNQGNDNAVKVLRKQSKSELTLSKQESKLQNQNMDQSVASKRRLQRLAHQNGLFKNGLDLTSSNGGEPNIENEIKIFSMNTSNKQSFATKNDSISQQQPISDKNIEK